MQKKLTVLYPFSSLLTGLVLTQVLATVQIYLSNIELYDSLLAIKAAGYLAVPNSQIMAGLRGIGPAFFGALFFSFSIGAGISFLAVALAWIWIRICYRNKLFVYAYLVLWIICLAVINLHGVNLFLTAIVLFVPSTVFAFASRRIAQRGKPSSPSHDAIHLLSVIVLALLLGWQADNRMFTDFRDIYLLSNPIGARINDFYYKYTLYPAEVLKSLNQKLLKTASLEVGAGSTSKKTLENILLHYDYIPVSPDEDVDLKIVSKQDDLNLLHRGVPKIKISSAAFTADPDKAIKEFENKTDTRSLLRQMTFISLLSGFPLAVYVIIHGMTSLLTGFFINARPAALIASMLCFGVCVIMMFAFQYSRGRDVSDQNLSEALGSNQWQVRVGALKFINEKGMEISQFKSYPGSLGSYHIAERYWLVRALANDSHPSTYDDLLFFLNDPHPNIVTMALFAIGKRGDPRAIEKISQLLAVSDNWYIQWYAYKALRSIGWRQTQLKQEP